MSLFLSVIQGLPKWTCNNELNAWNGKIAS
jgi:hypothetical protein